MKNVRNLLAAVCALLSATTMAVVYQPGAHVSEDAPIRVGAGLGAGLVYTKTGDKGEFGLRNGGLGLSFAHNVGYDFTYGVAVGGGAATLRGGRIFDDKGNKDGTGFGIDVDLAARFMPEIADALRLGGRLNLGYSHLIGGEDNAAVKQAKGAIKFPGVKVAIGPAVDWRASDMFSLYVSPALVLNHAMAMESDTVTDKETFKKGVNILGVEVAIEGNFAISENMGITVGTTTNIERFSEDPIKSSRWNYFKQDVVAGVNFAM